jgi:hypothetical protein
MPGHPQTECKLHSRRMKSCALRTIGKSEVGFQNVCVKRVTVLPRFYPNLPMTLLEQRLWVSR